MTARDASESVVVVNVRAGNLAAMSASVCALNKGHCFQSLDGA